jgi:hypothetical protein
LDIGSTGSEIPVAIASEHLWQKSDANKAIELQLFRGNSFAKRDSLTSAIVMLINPLLSLWEKSTNLRRFIQRKIKV